jgi:hypothetical protein
MALDPKKVEELRKLYDLAGDSLTTTEWTWNGEDSVAEDVPDIAAAALYQSVRETLPDFLREVESLREEVEALEADAALASGRADTIEDLSRENLALRALLRELVTGRCYDHADACCAEWCAMCAREVETVKKARALLASAIRKEP